MKDEVYDQIAQAMAEADNSKREAFEESIKRRKAEKAAIDAIRRVKFYWKCTTFFSFVLFFKESSQGLDCSKDM